MKYTRFIIQTPTANLYCHTTMSFIDFIDLISQDGDFCIVASSAGSICFRSSSVIKVWEWESDYKPTDS